MPADVATVRGVGMSVTLRSRGLKRAAGLALALAILAVLAVPAAGKPKRATRPAAPAASAATVTPIVPLTPAAQPARFFTINSVLAKLDGRTVAGPMRLASVTPGQEASDARDAMLPPASQEPFGLFAFRAPEGPLWVKQRKLAADIAAEADEINACREDASHCYAGPALRFIALTDHARKLTGRARLADVNRAINAAMTYTSDLAQHGVPDLWSAPLASLSSGQGDCEDYAIAKYVVLRAAGTPEDDLRVVLVRDRTVGQYHAVLAARQDGRWLVLDNRWPDLREDHEMKSFVPLFSLDSRGVSLFAAPYASELSDEADVTPATPHWGETGGGASTLPLLI